MTRNIFHLSIVLYITICVNLQGDVSGYTHIISEDIQSRIGHINRWNLASFRKNKIPYVINPNRPAESAPVLPVGTGVDEIIRDIQNGFQTWEDVNTSSIGFSFQGLSARPNIAIDGTNLVTMAADPLGDGNCGTAFTRVVSCLEAGVCILPNGKSVNVAFPGQIVDADIVYCTGKESESLSIDGSADTADLQARTTHEVGHFMGFAHTGILPSTMYGYASYDNAGIANRSRQTLSTNDVIGVSVLYPDGDFLADVGSIKGAVTMIKDARTDAAPTHVFGAHVVVAGSDGGVVADILTGVFEATIEGVATSFSMSSGDYIISGLPPGDYTLYVEPLDGPPAGATNAGFFGIENIRVDFGTAFFPETVTVSKGVTTRGIDFHVSPLNPNAPNMDVLTFTDPPSGFLVSGVGYLGTDHALAFGGGENIVSSNSNILPGTTFEISGRGVRIESNPFVNGGFIFIPISVEPNVPLGARNIIVRTPDGTSVLGGGLIIAESPPLISSINPTSGAAGALVTVSGAGFLPDSIVTVEGNMAASITVNSLSSITIEIPPPFSGLINSADIQVRNDAGTARLGDAFTYTGVAAVTPSPGPSPIPTPTLSPGPSPASTPASSPSPSLTPASTPIPIPTPSSLTIDPPSAKRSLLFQDAIVTVLDQDGQPLAGVIVEASVRGVAAAVSPASAVTGMDGAAAFRFRFGFLARDAMIIFTADGLGAVITQR